jgi:FkbM family methyltransferase
MSKNLLRAALEAFPGGSLLARNLRDQLDRRAPFVITPWGFGLAGHTAMAKGEFEPEETRLVRGLLSDVEVFVNVGANIGYYCCHALSYGKSVIAIEPMERNMHYLLKNIHGNDWAGKAQVFPVAAGAATGVLEMWGSGTGASLVRGWAGIPESYVRLVPVLTLDRILGNALAGKKALILADIEGAELSMLEGALSTLDNNPRPIWLIEISATEHQPAGILMNPNFVKTFEMFFSRGYSAYTADSEMRCVDMDDVLKIETGGLTLSTHNFLFR